MKGLLMLLLFYSDLPLWFLVKLLVYLVSVYSITRRVCVQKRHRYASELG